MILNSGWNSIQLHTFMRPARTDGLFGSKVISPKKTSMSNASVFLVLLLILTASATRSSNLHRWITREEEGDLYSD